MLSFRYSTVAVLFVLTVLAFADNPSGDKPPYRSIDKHALAATAKDEESLEALAKYLVEPCKTDKEKARAIFRWITDRISYDVETFLAGKVGDNSPTDVLKNRKAVCEGSANLFVDLCKRAGVKAVKIDGWAKGIGYTQGTTFNETNHAWNAVSIDNKWYLLDATWGAGNVQGEKFNKSFTEFYFLTPPERLIYSHLPKNEKWQLLKEPISKKQFEQRPAVNRCLLELGTPNKSILAVIDQKDFTEFTQGFTYPEFKVVVIEAPLSKKMKANRTYTFKIKSDDCTGIVAFNGKNLTDFRKNGNIFEGTVKVQKGELLIAGAVKDKKKNYRVYLEYRVE
jgi:hypothetical protein